MEEITAFIERNLTKGKLEELSLIVIESYRADDASALRSCAGALLGHEAAEKTEKKALFFRLIKLVHPDRLPVLQAEFSRARESRDRAALEFLSSLLSLKRNAARVARERFEYEHEEAYEWSQEVWDEFGLHEEAGYDDGDDEARVDETDMSFLDALKLSLAGTLDLELSPFDLGQLEGSLDVSRFDLYETDGLEFCVNVTELDLSGNTLDNIYDVRYLTHLRELYAADNRITSIEALGELEDLEVLDLSNNDIEDLTPLLSLERLMFLNVRKNPVRTREVLSELSRRGTAILH